MNSYYVKYEINISSENSYPTRRNRTSEREKGREKIV